MRTTVTFVKDWHLSSKQTTLSVVQAAGSEVPKQGSNIIRTTFSRARPTAAYAPIDVAKSTIWDGLELGLLFLLGLSGLVSILLFVAEVGNI